MVTARAVTLIRELHLELAHKHRAQKTADRFIMEA